jgi:ABC-type multidrug transport system permease subunit
MFFTTIALMLTAVSATGIFAADRYEAVDRVKNGIYTPAVFVGAQFLAAVIYDWIVTFIFISVFHWLTDLNPDGEAFIFDIFINWALMAVMESALLVAVEVIKNDFLCTTFGMIFIGCCMSVCGFFRSVPDMPPWISWMRYSSQVHTVTCLLYFNRLVCTVYSWIFPLKYAFDGFVYQVFHTQRFEISAMPGTYIEGDQVIR